MIVLLEAENIKKTFNRKLIFDHINFNLSSEDSLAITGKNGSGKTTLSKIIAGILTPTAGTVSIHINGKIVKAEHCYQLIGYVAPYLHLYDEFSGLENIQLSANLRGLKIPKLYLEELLQKVNLDYCKHDLVRTYSSGMQQRLKYAVALVHRPPILILDEPTVNLDEEGITMVQEIFSTQKKDNILIIATNDSEEAKLSEQQLNLDLVKEASAPLLV